MKTVNIFLLIMMSMIFTAALYGQKDNYNTTLKLSPIQFGKSYFELGLEIGLNEGKSSLQISPMALLKKNDFEEFSGIQLELQYRSYLKRLSNKETNTWIFSNIDFFAGAYALGLTYTEDYQISYYDPGTNTEIRNTYTQDIFSAETGVVIGVKFTLGDRITLDLLAGGGVRYSDVSNTIDEAMNIPEYYYYNDNTDEVFGLGYYGVKPKLNLQLGITL